MSNEREAAEKLKAAWATCADSVVSVLPQYALTSIVESEPATLYTMVYNTLYALASEHRALMNPDAPRASVRWASQLPMGGWRLLRTMATAPLGTRFSARDIEKRAEITYAVVLKARDKLAANGFVTMLSVPQRGKTCEFVLTSDGLLRAALFSAVEGQRKHSGRTHPYFRTLSYYAGGFDMPEQAAIIAAAQAAVRNHPLDPAQDDTAAGVESIELLYDACALLGVFATNKRPMGPHTRTSAVLPVPDPVAIGFALPDLFDSVVRDQRKRIAVELGLATPEPVDSEGAKEGHSAADARPNT